MRAVEMKVFLDWILGRSMVVVIVIAGGLFCCFVWHSSALNKRERENYARFTLRLFTSYTVGH